MQDYYAFGLSLRSELPFPELSPWFEGAPSPSITIMRGVVSPGDGPATGEKSFVEVRPAAREVICVYEFIGRFRVFDGREITVDANPGVDPALVRHALLGPVIAPLLWQRGLFTLHAAVIAVAEKAVAFVAASGEGKSTAGAALYFAGHTLVADDMAVIPLDTSPLHVMPAFPRLRAFADTLRGLGQETDALPRVHDALDKCSMSVERFAREPVPLAAIFVLQTGPNLSVSKLDKQPAAIELLRHSYMAHHLAPIVGFGTHLKMAARVAEQVPVYKLERPREFGKLSDLVRCVEGQLSSRA